MSDSCNHMLNSQKRKKKHSFIGVLLPILLRKTHQLRGVTYDVIDELRRLSLSKCFPTLCHKLIYHMILHLWSEISLFHKLIYVASFLGIRQLYSQFSIEYYHTNNFLLARYSQC